MDVPEEMARVLDDEGRPAGDLPVPDLDEGTLRGIYRDMRFARRFDERAVSLQRQGRLGTYAPLAGQEGSQVGSTYALRDEDWIVYQYREHGAVVVRGMTPAYLLYWMGHEAGNAALVEDRIAPLNITIADQIPHAVGLAWAADYRDDDCVVVVHFGDGATSEGDFHEAMNVAGVFDLPVVFVCNNNGWAISVPRARQTASRTIATKAGAYGFEGVQVDGMDPLASYAVTRAAVEKARRGDGPTLVEAVQYRYGAHTTADDPSAYREEAELRRWKERDPIDRFEAFCRARGVLDDEAVDAVDDRVEDRLAELVADAEAYGADPPEMFDHVYAGGSPELRRQRAAFEAARERLGDRFPREMDLS
jgi:pyruvate dehydrogenase E1 component alpha subunit